MSSPLPVSRRNSTPKPRASSPPQTARLPKLTAADILNKPLHTSIAVERDEFDNLEVAEKLHIIVSVKDFRAILHHAGPTSGSVHACYSRPGRPLKLWYKGDGLVCEFVLMTVGEKGPTRQPTRQGQGKRVEEARPTLDAAGSSRASASTNDNLVPVSLAPPARPAPRSIQFEMRPPPIPPSTLRSESLFVSRDDEARWEPIHPDEEDAEEAEARLDWDASNQPVRLALLCQRSTPARLSLTLSVSRILPRYDSSIVTTRSRTRRICSRSLPRRAWNPPRDSLRQENQRLSRGVAS